jgi:6-pyruvoyltetrahydropterin/6-carboxytetrahydropterin synthase
LIDLGENLAAAAAASASRSTIEANATSGWWRPLNRVRRKRSLTIPAETAVGDENHVVEVWLTVSSSGPRFLLGQDLEVSVADRDFDDVGTVVAERGSAMSSTGVLVSRRESFNAAHQLRDPRLSDAENERLYGKCANLHGHNYVLEVVVAGEIDRATGYVLDLKQLSDVISKRVIEEVDHRNLNTDVGWLEGVIPTAENLVVAFWERIRSELPAGSLRSVRLWETDKNWAEVGERA